MNYDYDLFVIGGGSGGLAAAKSAASYGAKVALAEGSLVGGTCVIRGCVPKKLMTFAANFVDRFEDAKGYGFSVPEIDFNFATLAQARNNEVARLNQLHIKWATDVNVEIIEGFAKFVDNHTLKVAEKTYTAKHVIIATGSSPFIPDIDGKEHVISSDGVWDLKELPKHMTIIGGGYIAVEFASIFKALGSEVSLIIRGDQILNGFDDDVRSKLSEEMTKRSIQIIPHEEVCHVTKNSDQNYLITLSSGQELSTSTVVAATGRNPNTTSLNLLSTNVQIGNKKEIKVNKNLQTSYPQIYAIGDVINRVNLTPVAIKHGRMVAENLFNNGTYEVDDSCAPTAVFSTPPIGTVGMSENEAIETHGQNNIIVYKENFKPMLFTLAGRDEKTFMKLIVRKSDKRILGMHMLGKDAPEIIQGFGVAVKNGLTKDDLDRTIAIHPTSAEDFVLIR